MLTLRTVALQVSCLDFHIIRLAASQVWECALCRHGSAGVNCTIYVSCRSNVQDGTVGIVPCERGRFWTTSLHSGHVLRYAGNYGGRNGVLYHHLKPCHSTFFVSSYSYATVFTLHLVLPHYPESLTCLCHFSQHRISSTVTICGNNPHAQALATNQIC